MFGGNMAMVNDYIMFRLLMEETDKKNQNRLHAVTAAAAGALPQQHHHRASLFIPRGSISGEAGLEPFCSPIVPHVPIRQRLARRCTSVDVGDDPIPQNFAQHMAAQQQQQQQAGMYPRRRRMSLLQTLRQQNRALADSGLDIARQRTDSESTYREQSSPPAQRTPPASPTKKTSFSSIKAKLFGKKDKRTDSRGSGTVYQSSGDYSQSCDVINGHGRSRKSPSTTNDSGRGSQGHLEDRIETVAIIERPDDEDNSVIMRPYRRIRTSSCPDLSSLRISISPPRRAPLVESESDEEPYLERNCSPPNASDYLVERRLLQKALEAAEKKRKQQHGGSKSTAVAITSSSLDEEEEAELAGIFREDDAISRITSISRRSNQTEDLADFDDNISTIVLDHYLPLSRSSNIHYEEEEDLLSSDCAASLILENSLEEEEEEEELDGGSGRASSIVQTDLSLLNVENEVTDYLTRLNQGVPIGEEGMNFIAKHFFEYQSFVNLPHKAVQLHKVPPQQAGTDPSMGWAPKNMNKAGKNQPAPAARANKIHRDPRPQGTKHGRAGKHEHREWGEKHGELREEKPAPHKDAWTKFLSNEDPGQRTVFECEFEDRVLQTEEETLPERVSRANPDDLEFQMAYNASKHSTDGDCELLTILTYAPTVQFVTATVKKAKCLPHNNSPFARIMLFDGRRLVEQKQTTVNPSVGHKSSIDTCSKPSSSSVSSSLSSSSGDASFSESFLFHVTPNKLDRCHIVIEMFDHDPSTGQAHSVGHCVIGRLGDGTGHAHWIQMLKKHGLPVCMWHKIGLN